MSAARILGCGSTRLPVFTGGAQTGHAMLLRFIRLNSAPEDGGNSQPPPPTPPAPAPDPAPPATKIVVEGTRTEREIELERTLENERTARRKAETDASYHADEARRLKELQTATPPAKSRRRYGFFEQEED